jgi:hypothetical protein
MASNTTICANSVATRETSFHNLKPSYGSVVTLTNGGTTHDTGISIPANFVLTGFSLRTDSISDTASDNITLLGLVANPDDPNLFTQTAIAHIVGVVDTARRYYLSASTLALAAGRNAAGNLEFTTDADPANTTTQVEVQLYGYHMI